MILAPLRGVTIRCFRETFAEEIRAAGFTEAITPFVPAMRGCDPFRDRELRRPGREEPSAVFRTTPQFIGKDPAVFRDCLTRIRAAGYETADLNCGCPYPMVRRKGRGSGILKTPEVLRSMLEVGCEVMGPGRFSVKARLGVDRGDELLGLMPMINSFPLRFLTVHARTARQMYGGTCDAEALAAVERAANVPIVRNGDLPFPPAPEVPSSDRRQPVDLMVGRSFVRHLGGRSDACDLLRRYLAASKAELNGDLPVLGRMKELVAYWKDLPAWRRRWQAVKLCRTTDEFLLALNTHQGEF